MIALEIPNKSIFFPAELQRLFKDFPGFSKSSVYRKISEGKIEAEYSSERGTYITRKALLKYFASINLSH